MATVFPGSDDSFSEPAAPSSTPLDDAGGSGRTMVVNHRDLGDAIEAMQAQATVLIHSHDGSTARHGSKLAQANTHQTPDTDAGLTSLHHTIGTGAGQGAAGNHSHSVSTVWPVGSVFITEVSGNPGSSPHDLPGTWTAITGSFLVAAGSTFTAGSTGGAATHSHTATLSTVSGHTHTSADTSAIAAHSHTSGNTGSSTFGHTHSSSSSSAADATAVGPDVPGSTYAMINASHTHSGGGASTSSHAHSVDSTGSDGSHAHTVAAVDASPSHDHTSTMDAASNLPSYLVVYVWYRSA